MLFSRNRGQTRGVKARVQVGYTLGPLTVLVLTGCSSLPGSMNPVSWWHDLEGGKIAEERPPPPGADEPYPNLASVPPKPAAPDRAALAKIANALIADRTNAQHVAAAAPIADPSSPNASPDLFGRGSVAPPGPPQPPGNQQQASATMPAVEAPPAAGASPSQSQTSQPASATAPPPAKAPVGSVETTPLAPPGATAQPPAVAAGTPPALPAAPPPPPHLPGVPSTPSSSAPATVPATPPPTTAATQVAAATPPPAPAANATGAVSVAFVNGSAELPSAAADTLKQLAARRGSGVIAVTGFGDATSDDPDAQSAALALGLSRAKAMAAALASAGVPASAVQVDAAAIGRGGSARLIQ